MTTHTETSRQYVEAYVDEWHSQTPPGATDRDRMRAADSAAEVILAQMSRDRNVPDAIGLVIAMRQPLLEADTGYEHYLFFALVRAWTHDTASVSWV